MAIDPNALNGFIDGLLQGTQLVRQKQLDKAAAEERKFQRGRQTAADVRAEKALGIQERTAEQQSKLTGLQIDTAQENLNWLKSDEYKQYRAKKNDLDLKVSQGQLDQAAAQRELAQFQLSEAQRKVADEEQNREYLMASQQVQRIPQLLKIASDPNTLDAFNLLEANFAGDTNAPQPSPEQMTTVMDLMLKDSVEKNIGYTVDDKDTIVKEGKVPAGSQITGYSGIRAVTIPKAGNLSKGDRVAFVATATFKTPSGEQQIEVPITTDRSGKPDSNLFNVTLGELEEMVTRYNNALETVVPVYQQSGAASPDEFVSAVKNMVNIRQGRIPATPAEAQAAAAQSAAKAIGTSGAAVPIVTELMRRAHPGLGIPSPADTVGGVGGADFKIVIDSNGNPVVQPTTP